MPLTRSFRETVKARADRDPAFRAALLAEAVEALACGDTSSGKALLRDFIKATIGFEALGRDVAIDPKNLMRMLGPRGNPQLGNLAAVLRALERHEGILLRVEPVRI